jgi:hypothetical protein
MIKHIAYLLLFLLSAGILSAQEEQVLDGTWEIIFDHKNEGKNAGWATNKGFVANQNRRPIIVPSVWETIEKDYEGVGIYRHEFVVAEGWNDKVIHLRFEAVNYLSEVWLNDEVVGFHEGGFTPFEFRVDEMAKPGETNVLIVRVVGPITLSDKTVDGIKAMESPQWRAGISGGIWQGVSLVATDDLYLEDVHVQPSFSEKTVDFHLAMDHAGLKQKEASIQVVISEAKDGKEVASVMISKHLHPGVNKHSLSLAVPNAHSWSPASPNLYHADVKVSSEGQLSDSYSGRFGFREFTIRDKDFYLNGKPIYLKATFFEGLYPNKVAYPDDVAMVREEIRLAKEAGFNMIRPWRKPSSDLWLDIADEMGILVVSSPALECMTLPMSTPYLPMRVENEIREAVLKDRNRTCIVQWELFNELHRPVLKQLMRPMAMLTRELDPTRMILDESGGWAYGANIYLPGAFEPVRFNDIHNYPGPFITNEKYDGYLSIGMTEQEKKMAGLKAKTPGRNVVPGLMSFVSELGYGSLPNLKSNNERFRATGNPLLPAYRYHERLDREQGEMLRQSGFQYLYPDTEAFYLDMQKIHGTANKRMIEGVRANPRVDGYCIHALSAGDWILGAGLIDLWRQPKTYAYEATKAANQPRVLSIRTLPSNVRAKDGMELEVIGINDLETLPARLEVVISAEDGRVVYEKKIEVEFGHRVSTLLNESLSTRKWKGSYLVSARAYDSEGELLSENSFPFTVFTTMDLRLAKPKVAVFEPIGPVADALRQGKVKVTTFGENTSLSTPVYVGVLPTVVEEDKLRYQRLIDFMERGGTVVYAEGVQGEVVDGDPRYPFTCGMERGMGLWSSIPHLVRDHPVFLGLPVDTMMRNEYEHVWAPITLTNLRGLTGETPEVVVAAIGHQWFSREHKLHYSGPGASWWGADLAIIPVGKGRCVVSQLKLLPHLGKDPAADLIWNNLLRFID